MHSANVYVAEVIILFKVSYAIKIWQIARKSNALYFPNCILSLKFGTNWMKTVAAVALWKSRCQEFCKVHRMTTNCAPRIRHEK